MATDETIDNGLMARCWYIEHSKLPGWLVSPETVRQAEEVMGITDPGSMTVDPVYFARIEELRLQMNQAEYPGTVSDLTNINPESAEGLGKITQETNGSLSTVNIGSVAIASSVQVFRPAA